MSTSRLLKYATFALPLLALAFFLIPDWDNGDETAIPTRAEFEAMLAAHPYSTREHLTEDELRSIPKKDRPDLAAEQDFLRTLDPASGEIPVERLFAANVLASEQLRQARASGGGPLVTEAWEERGPTNVAGRTRAILFDPNDATNKRVFAGGVAGGLWVTEDITTPTVDWLPIDDFWANLAVSSITYNPSNTLEMYAGTGEGYFNIDAVRGSGIFKSIDGGTTWDLLPATNNPTFYYTQRLAVHHTSGDIYAATRSGIRRSQDGGNSWELVLSGRGVDLAIVPDGRIYATAGIFTAGQVFSTDTGNDGDWDQLNSGSNGFPTGGIQRVEIATSPVNSDLVYAVTQSTSGGVGAMYKTTDGGTTWSTIAQPNDVEYGSDFSRGQAWYDLSLAVDPSSEDTLYVGGINTFRSTNGGGSWTQLSHWTGSFGFPYVHADQHGIAFMPGSSDIVIFSHDGGISYTENATDPSPSFINRNKNYNVTQFYAGAINPTSGSNIMLAGAQDNGTQRFAAPGLGGTTEVRGGDGGFTFIDQTEDNYAISSYVRNTYSLSTNGGVTYSISLINDNTGSFINPADYDDIEDILYSYRTSSSLYRVLDVTGSRSVSQITGSFGGTVTHLRVSPYSAAGTSTLFIGTQSGRMFRIDDAESTPSITEITGPFVGAVSSIDFGSSEDQILLTASNYGITSVWESIDGGATWQDKEGDLPDMPVRWAMYNPMSRNGVLLATEAGVWETANFNVVSPHWTIAPEFPLVRTDMLQLRESDMTVMATTHGRGVFTATLRPVVTSNEDTPLASTPRDYQLSSAYPNPFNPQTQFTLSVDEPQRVQATLFDARGRQIRVLQDGDLSAGATHTIRVDGTDLPSGMYLVAIEGETFRDQLRITLVK